jgi:hypothetical protein
VAFSTYIEYGSPVSSDYAIYSSSGSSSYSSSSSFSVVITTGAMPTGSGSDEFNTSGGSTIEESLYSYESSNNTDVFTGKTEYLSEVGFNVENEGVGYTYYFSDYYGAEQYTTSATNANFDIKKTTETNLETVLYDSTATWTDATTTLSNVNILYTNIQLSTTIGFQVPSVATLYFASPTLHIASACGYVWTAGENALQYLHYFTNVGEVSYNGGSRIKEDEGNVSIPAEFTALNGNLTPAFSTDTTIQEEVNTTISYEYLDVVNSTFEISSNSIQFDGVRFSIDTDYPTSFNYFKSTIASSTTSFNLASLISFGGNSDDAGSRDILTTTKAIQISKIDTFYHINSFYSDFESFTYKGLIKTTAESSYLLFEAPAFGSGSFSSSSANTFYTVDGNEIGTVTEASGETAQNASAGTTYRIKQKLYKSFYSLQLGIANDEWKKYYTRKVGNSNFAVQKSDGLGFSYVGSLTPTSVLTKCFFTSYKFERTGAGKVAVLYVPINYTSAGTDSKTTEQTVSVPQSFYFGSTQASIYWTTKSEVNTSSTQTGTTSFVIGYAGGEGMLSIGYDAVNDFETNTFSPPFVQNKIFHTEPSIYSGSWSKDGYYYYNSSNRTSSGNASNAISVVGDGQYATYIASEYVGDMAFPVVSIIRSYVNSYGN